MSELIRERSEKNKTELDGLERDDIDQIYLFFDYDGYASLATDEKITQMLVHFDNETENGKLYVSYPMIEAYRDLNSFLPFKDNVVQAKENIGYKGIVGGRSQFLDLRQFGRDTWKHVITENLCKSNYIVNDNYTLPDNTPEQTEIFEKQLDKYIEPSNQVAVLSAFPFFIDEYFEEVKW